MKGADGRFYDSTFDLNRDGRLDAAEMSFMDLDQKDSWVEIRFRLIWFLKRYAS